MTILAAGLFDWIHFSVDRITNPVVITGLALIAVGIISLIIANPVNNTKKVQEFESKTGRSDTFIAGFLKVLGYALILVGCITAAVVK